MLTDAGTPILRTGASASTLRAVASALRTGQVSMPPSGFALAMAGCSDATLLSELQRLSAEGMSASHLALVVELTASAIEQRVLADRAGELVWTGPSNEFSHSRDTLVVVEELFFEAKRSILLSTFVIQQPEQVLAPLMARMDAVPELEASIYLHVGRENDHDTRLDSAILAEFRRGLEKAWGTRRRPRVFYDPRGLSPDRATRATWHAKCLIADDEVSFVTSANFTVWAQQRNVEAGVLVRSREFSLQLRSHFDALVMTKHVQRLPGF